MRIDRLKLNIGAESFDLTLHPRLTFLSGVNRSHRDQVGRDVLSALQEGRPGLSLDVTGRDGRLLEVYRPTDGATTVRDAISGADLTDRFLVGEQVNLLASRYRRAPGDEPPDFEALHIRSEHDPTDASGNDRDHHKSEESRRRSHQTGSRQTDPGIDKKPTGTSPTSPQTLQPPKPAISAPSAQTEHMQGAVEHLAQLNQDTLWATAMVLAETEVEVESHNSNAAGRDHAAQRRATAEACHTAVEVAAELLESDRSLLLSISATLSLVAIISAVVLHPLLSIPFLLAAIGTGSVSGSRWRQLILASRAESEALRCAGIHSYVGLQHQRANAANNETTLRPALQLLEEIHGAATQAWVDLVGPNISLAWAVESRPQIDQLATTRSRRTSKRSRGRAERATPRPTRTAADDVQRQDAFDHLEVLDSPSPLISIHQRLSAIEENFAEAVPVVIDHAFQSTKPRQSDSPSTINEHGPAHTDPSRSGNLSLIVDLLELHSGQLQLIIITDNPDLLKHFAGNLDRARILDLSGRTNQGIIDAPKVSIAAGTGSRTGVIDTPGDLTFR